MAVAQSNTSLSTDSNYSGVIERVRAHPLINDQFEDIDTILGYGGGGIVLKVRSKTDGKFYALKLIPLDTSAEEEKLMREVKVLANLNHENVVRYNTSWIIKHDAIDKDVDDIEKCTDTDIQNKVIDKSDNIMFEDDKNEQIDVESDVSYSEYSEDSSSEDDEPEKVDSNVITAAESTETSCIKEPETTPDIKVDDKSLTSESTETSDLKEFGKRVLCIQMEYCQQNLKEFVNKGQHFSDLDEQSRIMNEIVDGMQYIHSQGVIHRDLKPANIFLDSLGKIKIGDFGFAVQNVRNSVSNQNHGVPETTSTETSSTNLTKNLGTYLYMSPEICQQDSKYDNRVDLYSLGIIIFELCYKFTTEMERLAVVENLRREEILFPDDFQKKTETCSNIRDVIVELLKHDPDERITLCAVKEKVANISVEELDMNDIKTVVNDDLEHCPFLQSVGCVRVKGKPRGFCFRVGSTSRYILTTNKIAKMLRSVKSESKPCSVEFLDPKLEKKHRTFYLNARHAWMSTENNLAILRLSLKSKRIPPPSYTVNTMTESNNDLSFIQIVSKNPFQYKERNIRRDDFMKMSDDLQYIKAILPKDNMGSPIFQMSENGSYSVCGMLLGNYYADGQKKGTCVIDGQKIYECFSPAIPRDLRKDIFADSKFYRCHEHLMMKIERLERENRELKRSEKQLAEKVFQRLLPIEIGLPLPVLISSAQSD